MSRPFATLTVAALACATAACTTVRSVAVDNNVMPPYSDLSPTARGWADAAIYARHLTMTYAVTNAANDCQPIDPAVLNRRFTAGNPFMGARPAEAGADYTATDQFIQRGMTLCGIYNRPQNLRLGDTVEVISYQPHPNNGNETSGSMIINTAIGATPATLFRYASAITPLLDSPPFWNRAFTCRSLYTSVEGPDGQTITGFATPYCHPTPTAPAREAQNAAPDSPSVR